MIKNIKCKHCGREFTIEIFRGNRQAYCNEKCRTDFHVAQRLKYRKEEPVYLKGDENVFDLLIADLDKKGIDFSDYKKQLSLSKVSKINLTI